MAEKTEAEIRLDGWRNLLTGMGIRGRDKTKSTDVDNAPILDHMTLQHLFAGDSIGNRMVSALPEDMVRAGWTITGDDDGKLNKAQQRLGVKKNLRTAMKWAQLFGGGIIHVDVQGGPVDLATPLDPTKITKVKGLRVYPKPRITIQEDDYDKDPSSPYFEDIKQFRIQRLFGGMDLLIHRSRCLVFKGMEIAQLTEDSRQLDERFWGLPVLSPAYSHLSSFGALIQGMGHMGQEFSVAKMRLSNLEQLVASNDYAALEKRAEIIAVTKSLINAVLLGQDEEYSRDTVSFTGVPDLFDRMMMIVAGPNGYPVTRIFGRSAAGMNATGEGDMKQYHERVSSEQETTLLPELTRLIEMINYGEGTPIPTDNIEITFNPLAMPTAKEEADTRKVLIDGDAVLIDKNVLSPAEARKRHEGKFSTSLTVEEGSDPPEPPETPENLALLAGKVPPAQPPVVPVGGKVPPKSPVKPVAKTVPPAKKPTMVRGK